jgi:hypothetical protein
MSAASLTERVASKFKRKEPRPTVPEGLKYTPPEPEFDYRKDTQYAEAADNLVKLQTRLKDIEAEAAAHRAWQQTERQRRAAQISGLVVGAKAAEPDPEQKDPTRTLDAIDSERRVMAEAIEQQKAVLTRRRIQCGKQVVEMVREEYRAIAARIDAAARELQDALRAEHELAEKVEAYGGMIPQRANMPGIQWFPDPEKMGSIELWRRDAQRDGWLE